MASTRKGRVVGLLASVAVVGAVIGTEAWRPTGAVGYLEIKTVPAAPLTQAALYFDAKRLGPIKEGSAILSQPVGTRHPQASGARICRRTHGAVQDRGAQGPHYHSDDFRARAPAALPMPLYRQRTGERARMRELIALLRAGEEPELRKVSPSSGRALARRHAALFYFIIGMTNSAPSLTPEGQRAVIVLVRV